MATCSLKLRSQSNIIRIFLPFLASKYSSVLETYSIYVIAAIWRREISRMHFHYSKNLLRWTSRFLAIRIHQMVRSCKSLAKSTLGRRTSKVHLTCLAKHGSFLRWHSEIKVSKLAIAILKLLVSITKRKTLRRPSSSKRRLSRHSPRWKNTPTPSSCHTSPSHYLRCRRRQLSLRTPSSHSCRPSRFSRTTTALLISARLAWSATSH